MSFSSRRPVVAATLTLAALFLWLRVPRGKTAAMVLLCAVGLSEATGSLVIKPWMHRARPCRAVASIRAPEGCDDGYSFPSDHAAISASAVVALACAVPFSVVASVPLSLVVGASRIYLGQHYLSDVLAGYLLGALSALVLDRAVRFRRESR